MKLIIEITENSYKYLKSKRNKSAAENVIANGLIYREQPTGEWIEGEYGNIKCNHCGCEIRYSYLIGNNPEFPKFCCDCGAKMKGGETNETDN